MTRSLSIEDRATVRKVRLSDCDDILEISRHIWEGHDYVPQILDEWLKNPKCHTYGVETDDRLVGIGNLRLTDRNQTGWMEGLRVHPDYRRRGYAEKLTDYFVKLGSKLKVKQLRYTTGQGNRISLRLAKKAGFKRIFKMTTARYENISQTAKPERTSRTITHITPEEAYEQSKTNGALIPRAILFYDWKAINATLQGFREIGKDHNFYATMKNHKLEALSFGHERSEVPSWGFTVYALGEDNFTKHFHHQIGIALNKSINTAVCTCPTIFERLFKEHEKIPKPVWKLQSVVLEKKMRP